MVWRLHNDRNQRADCCLEITQTGAMSITVRCGGEVKLTALAIRWEAAQQIVDDSRRDLLREGWREQRYLTSSVVS